MSGKLSLSSTLLISTYKPFFLRPSFHKIFVLIFLFIHSETEPRPPGEESEEVAWIQRVLDNVPKESPLIGIEFIVEIQGADKAENKYHCFLCDRDFEATALVSDLVSGEHRMNYLVSGIVFGKTTVSGHLLIFCVFPLFNNYCYHFFKKRRSLTLL